MGYVRAIESICTCGNFVPVLVGSVVRCVDSGPLPWLAWDGAAGGGHNRVLRRVPLLAAAVQQAPMYSVVGVPRVLEVNIRRLYCDVFAAVLAVWLSLRSAMRLKMLSCQVEGVRGPTCGMMVLSPLPHPLRSCDRHIQSSLEALCFVSLDRCKTRCSAASVLTARSVTEFPTCKQ